MKSLNPMMDWYEVANASKFHQGENIRARLEDIEIILSIEKLLRLLPLEERFVQCLLKCCV